MNPQILYSDDQIFVVRKPVGILSEETADRSSLADWLREQNNGYIGVVHRLDRGVGGVMVYAKTKPAAAKLSAAVQAHTMQKTYLAVVHGKPPEAAATLTDLLFHDRTKNKTYAVDRERRGVKPAILDYEVLSAQESPVYGTVSKLKIQLRTGRTHQIRVQFASRGLPLVGDNKYGAHDRTDIALFCCQIVFPHPKTGKILTFTQNPVGDVWGY